MANWKERYKNLREKAGMVGGKLAAGGKDSAKTAGGGALAFLALRVGGQYIPESIPYGKAAAVAVAGHFLRRKYPHIGNGFLGLAGAMLLDKVIQNNPDIAKALPGQQATGYEDGNAGAFPGYYGEAGALQQGGASGYADGYGEEAGALQGVGAFDDMQGYEG